MRGAGEIRTNPGETGGDHPGVNRERGRPPAAGLPGKGCPGLRAAGAGPVATSGIAGLRAADAGPVATSGIAGRRRVPVPARVAIGRAMELAVPLPILNL